MTQYNSQVDWDLSSDEQVVSYLLNIRTRTFKLVSGVLEAIDLLQDARSDIQALLAETEENGESHKNSRRALLMSVEASVYWSNLLARADNKLAVAAQCAHELSGLVNAFAGDRCSLAIRKAIEDVRASQEHMDDKLHFSRVLLADLHRLKGDLVSARSATPSS